MAPLRVLVLASGSGTLLQALIDACADPVAHPRLADVDIVAVGTDRPGIAALDRAQAAGIATFVHPLERGADRSAWDAGLADLVAAHHPDLVVSAGFMKLLGTAFLDRFAGRIINTHPALLPSFPGAHGVRDALAHGVLVTGCSLFVVDEGVDTGRLLAQEAVRVLPDDTEQTLHERIKVVERQMLIDTVADWPRPA